MNKSRPYRNPSIGACSNDFPLPARADIEATLIEFMRQRVHAAGEVAAVLFPKSRNLTSEESAEYRQIVEGHFGQAER